MTSAAPATSPETNPKLPLTPEELADRLIPESPQISPDGRHVAFTVRTASQKGEHRECAIWLSRDGAPAAKFTSGLTDDHSPRWSPDGTRIAFISDRADPKERKQSRLYVIRIDGGEAQQVGELEGKLSEPAWSPDGAWIALLREDPESEEEKKRKEERNDALEVETERKRNRLWIIDVESGAARQLTYGTRQIWSFGWSRGGQEIVVAATEGYDENASCGAGDIYAVPVAGGLFRHVARFPALPTNPVYVSGGIAAIASDHWEDPPQSIWFVPAGFSESRNLLPGYKGQVEGMAPVAGNDKLLALRVVEGTHAGAYLLDVETATLTKVTAEGQHGEGSLLAGPSPSQDATRFAVIWSDGHIPQEVYITGAGEKPAPLTELGKPFLGRLSPVETVAWQSDGWEIEGLLTYPAGYEPGTQYPLVVEVHGGPSWQWEDYAFLDWHDWAQLLASNGFAVLAPNPRGSTGRGAEFEKQLQNDVGGGEVRDLVGGALAMVERGIADRERLGIGGWSWGGYLTATTITKSDIFKAAVMGAGLSNLISDHGTGDIPAANLRYFSQWPYENFEPFWEGSAMKNIANCKTPTLILHGDEDARVRVSQGAEMFRALKTLGVPVEFIRYPREEHPIKERNHQIDLMRRVVAWYTKWLKS